MARIIYFTGKGLVTPQEQAEIAELNTIAAQPYEVLIANAEDVPDYGPNRPVPGDYVAGAVPALYLQEDEDDGRIYQDFDIENPPAPPNLPSHQAVVSDGQEIAVTGGTVTLEVEDGVVTATFTEA